MDFVLVNQPPQNLILYCYLIFVNYVYEAFNNGNQVDVIYADFKKAFGIRR